MATTTIYVENTPEIPYIPIAPEPVRPVRVKIGRAEVLKRFFKNDEQLFDLAYASYRFPRSIGRNQRTHEPMWMQDDCETWRTSMRQEIARLTAVLK